MMMKTLTAMAALAAVLSATTDAAKVTILNSCADDIQLSHLGKGVIYSVEKLVSGSTMTKDLPTGTPSHLFKAGTGAQATLAELTPAHDAVYYDISIIPTGNGIGPGNCGSFAECKAVTKGHSFNYPMQLIPRAGYNDKCRPITCMYDGCPEAYLFPNDVKTRACRGSPEFTLTFCPGGPGRQTPPPTPSPTPTPTTPAPTTSQVDEPTLQDGSGSQASINGTIGGAVAEDRTLDLDTTTEPVSSETPAPTTVVPIVVPEQQVQEVTTKSSNGGHTGAEVYVILSIGAAAMIAGAAIFVSRKKKQEMEALEEKSPRPRTTTACGQLFVLSTPTDASVL